MAGAVKVEKFEWKIEGKVHKPSKPLKCPFCGGEMHLRFSRLNPIRDTETGKAKEAYADDMRWKCDGCSFAPQFGVPTSKEDAQKMLEERGGNPLLIPESEWAENEALRQKLECIGYC